MGLDNPVHLIFIVVILLLLFGAKRLPEIGRSLGSGMREFKQSVTGEDGQPPQNALTAPQQQPPHPPVAQAPEAQAAPVAQAPVPPVPAPPAPAAVAPEPASVEPQQHS